jgi:hypothetical protein
MGLRGEIAAGAQLDEVAARFGGLCEPSGARRIRRVVLFIAAVRATYPELVISADTWRQDEVRE